MKGTFVWSGITTRSTATSACLTNGTTRLAGRHRSALKLGFASLHVEHFCSSSCALSLVAVASRVTYLRSQKAQKACRPGWPSFSWTREIRTSQFFLAHTVGFHSRHDHSALSTTFCLCTAIFSLSAPAIAVVLPVHRPGSR